MPLEFAPSGPNRGADLRALAILHRRMNLTALCQLASLGLQIPAWQVSPLLGVAAVVVLTVVQLWTVMMVEQSVRAFDDSVWGFVGLCLIACGFVPVISLVVLMLQSQRVHELFERMDIHVGMVGLRRADIERLPHGLACDCGYDTADLPSGAPCPECGHPIRPHKKVNPQYDPFAGR